MSSSCLYPLTRQRLFINARWTDEEAQKQHREALHKQQLQGGGLASMRNGFAPLLQLDTQLELQDDGCLSESTMKRQKFALYIKECSKVHTGLYIGGEQVATDLGILRDNQIKHVVNCVGSLYPEHFKDEMRYKTLYLQDTPKEDLMPILYDTLEFIDTAREAGENVLVHCSQGVSRSTSIGIAYLMWKLKETYEVAHKMVRDERAITCPNIGFYCQLKQWYKRRKERPVRPRVYRIAPHCEEAATYLVPKLVVFKGQAPASVECLDPRFSFVIHHLQQLYVWHGSKSLPAFQAAAARAADLIHKYEEFDSPRPPVITVKQGEEPEPLQKALRMASDNGETVSLEPSTSSVPAVLEQAGTNELAGASTAEPMEIGLEESTTSVNSNSGNLTHRARPDSRGSGGSSAANTRPPSASGPFMSPLSTQQQRRFSDLGVPLSSPGFASPRFGNPPFPLPGHAGLTPHATPFSQAPPPRQTLSPATSDANALAGRASAAGGGSGGATIKERDDYNAELAWFYDAARSSDCGTPRNRLFSPGSPWLMQVGGDGSRPESPSSTHTRKYRRSESERSLQVTSRSRQNSMQHSSVHNNTITEDAAPQP